jgi:Excalibur calcium-binding domain
MGHYTVNASAMLSCDIAEMRSMLLLVAAVMLGLTGGYAWSKWSGHAPARSAARGSAAHGPAPVYYANCAAARAAGAGDLYPGLPGYRPELDSNGDGVACSAGDAAS